MTDSLTPKQYAAQRQASLIKTITELRERHGLSQQDLADLLGCSRSRIARLERDSHGEYGVGELEILALRFGQEPALFLSLSSPERDRLDQAYAAIVTAPGLGQRLTCALPPDVSLKVDAGLELAWSSDGAFLAGAVPEAGGEKYLLCVWEATSGDLIRTLRTDGYISALAFNPDGRLIATATDMDTIDVWDWQEQRAVACLDPVDGSSYSQELWDFVGETDYGIISLLQFSPDGTILAAVNEGHGTLRLWHTATWQESHTLSLPHLFAELEVRRAQLELGSSWQITWAEEEEPPLRYGEFSVKQLAFTPDGQMLAVLPFLSRQLEFFSLTGQHIRGEIFSRQVRSIDLVGLNQSGEMLLVACGGEEQLFEVWYQRAGYEREFIHTTIDDPPLEATIQDLKILDANCVLGLVQNKERAWKLVNLVSQQPLPLPEVNPWSLNVLIAPDGQAVAYPDTTGQIQIQRLRPEYLAQSGPALKIHTARRQQTTPAHLSSLFERVETEEDWQEHLRLALEQSHVRYEAETPEPVTVPPEPVADWLERIRSAGAEGEAYGLAILSPEDQTTVQVLVGTLSNSYDQVWSVDLPQPGPRIKERALLAYLTQRSLRRDESIAGVIAELERNPGDVIIIDHAEKLHHQTLLGLCSSLQAIAGVFLLVVRNQESFLAEAEKIRAGLDWFLSRAIWYNELAQLNQQAEEMVTDIEAEGPELITPKESRLEFGLYRLKTATPRAQGGYGLAMLLPEDTITVQRFMDKVQRETADQIILAQLPRQGAKIKLRQLVENIVGRPLKRGESTDGVIHRQIRGQYNLIVIDNAERLHYSTLLWICSNLRSIVEAFLLVVRDEEAFMKMVDKTIDPGWTLGRSISIDLARLAAEE
jgi:transcriptional regulator with XRE-family HTH domain